MIREQNYDSIQGVFAFIFILLSSIAALAIIVSGCRTIWDSQNNFGFIVVLIGVVLFISCLFSLKGLVMVEPNQGKVLQFFGSYVGTVKYPGLRWVNPFYSKKSVSLRVRNFETSKLKVNDSLGNPIEIAAVVVWKVSDSAEAVFQVDNYEQFVTVQSESASRNLATKHPYDQHVKGNISLRSHTEEVAEKLKSEIQERLSKAGIQVIEARISHLAYASEIAGVMLRQQQADAIIAARKKIVEGAVGMVHMALDELVEKHKIKMDDERKASMVSNLLVVLCGDRDANPVVNVGSLYQ